MRFSLLIALFILMYPHAAVPAENPCGGDTCSIEMGEYAIRLPEKTDGKSIPALLWFHGAGRSGPLVMKNSAMIGTFTKRGYAVIAPSGLERPNSRFGPGWSFLPFRPKQRDELTFAKAVLNDVQKRFNIDNDNILMSGFSIGGSLVWYLACKEPGLARAYAPVAGAFWRPHPQTSDCKGPVKFLHTHGWRDGTVPLEGRPLGGGRIYQGDVFHGLSILRELNGCEGLKATVFETEDRFWRRKWVKCSPQTALEFALHTGGHNVPGDWPEMAIEWFEGLKNAR